MRLFTAIPLLFLSQVCLGDQSGMLFFEKHIRPALIENCYECHSHQAGKQKGGLYLDSRAGWEKGGDIGPTIIPGDTKNSLLLKVIRYQDPDLEMPPKKRLSDDLVKKFEQWVAMGAPDPRLNRVQSASQQGTVDDSTGYSLEKGREFWSFKPRKWQIPTGTKWAATEIDRFIEVKLNSIGIGKADPAPPAARLRRAKTDLTGLPPTIAEQDEFLADPSEAKWQEMIDRWLASQDFGERWGRHWLDLARYADTSGGGRAMPLPEAWRFRDFVIDAFNNDMPLDHLILSHIAGDLLPYRNGDERTDNLTSTGFMVLGPHNYENQNKALLDLEIADEQIDTMGRAFLGMTIGCARCHDHKFDPIPTKDYYALAGIFLSSKSVAHSNVSKWHLEPVPGSSELQEKLRIHQQKEKELKEVLKVTQQKLNEAGGKGVSYGKSAKLGDLKGIVLDDTKADLKGEWFPSTSNPRYVAAGYLHDSNSRNTKMSAVFSTTVPASGIYEIRLAYSSGTNRSTKTPVNITAGEKTETIRVNQRKKPPIEGLFFQLGKYELEAGQSVTITITNEPGKSDGCVIVDAVQILPYQPTGESKAPTGEIDLTKLRKAYEQSKKALADHAKKAPKLPKVMAIADLEPAKIKDTPVRIRGDEDTHGEIAPRGFLQVASFSPVSIPDKQSGRLELGKWIVDPDHPLTARVMANRVWLHLMGEGIVRSPDNFGTTGRQPSHPQLLDYLAQRLIDSGWSVKSLIKEIMLSEVYRFDSEVNNEAARKKDPENHYLWRANRRSLDAEVLRDSMLVVSGLLDESRGGTSLPSNFKSEFGFRFKTRKRSVYVPVFRNTGYELFTLFDFANPNFIVGDRGSSAVPTQALYLLNSPDLHLYAEEAAKRVMSQGDLSFEERLALVFRSALGRKFSVNELDWANHLFENEGDKNDVAKWATLHRMLFASLDFRFLR